MSRFIGRGEPAKTVLNSGWGTLKVQLQYTGKCGGQGVFGSSTRQTRREFRS